MITNIVVNVSWALVWVEVRSGIVASLIRPWMPWS
jgi:hypothetical protein